MRQPYYICTTSNGEAYLYNDYGNRASKNMPVDAAKKICEIRNASGFRAMEERDFDSNGKAKHNY